MIVARGAAKSSPFSRIKSVFANITEDDARAKGYLKGNKKKEEVFSLLKRTTTPTTIYKKQKLDRDNVVDITDFDVIAWLKSEMRLINEPERGIFIAESPMVVERALEKDCKPVSFLLDKKILNDKINKMLATLDVPVYIADDRILCSITGFHLTRGMLCAMKRPPEENIEKILDESSRIAVLENVMNPTNMGALFRSATALGMDAVIVTKGGCDPLYRRCVRVSMGTVFQLPWAYLPENYGSVDFLRQMGFKTVAMALRKNSVSIDDDRLNSERKLALVLGSEGSGLNDSTIDSCDYTVMIPMTHGVDSLNVVAAAAIAFYEIGLKKYKSINSLA